ncbi:M48 family metalloprotease [Porticoccaceae bacterium]|nr:M48 family metalloprotease [Porticoccaceae bacterium]
MKTRYSWSILLVLAMAAGLSGCSVNPVTGKNELSFMSQQQEIALGSKNYSPSRQSQGGDYYLDPKLQSYVAGVGKKLAAVSDQPNLPYEFVVLNNSVPNAWALPGGKIAINRGLLSYLDDESQLAAVLAHEIVHAAARHGASQMSRGTLANIGMAAVAIGTQGRDGGQLYGLASQMGTAAWMAKYGRDDELESDFYGMNYMAVAGYEPQGAVELQRTFVKLSEGRQTDFLSGLFASHPPSEKRVEANIAKAKQLPKGQRYRQRYQAAIAQLRKDESAYKAEKAAIEALNKEQPAAAIDQLDRAIAVQPGEAAFWELRGHAWNLMDKTDNAEKAYSTAIRKNPKYFGPHLARGVLRYNQGEKARGLEDIQRSYKILPTAKASYYLGESAVQAKQYQAAMGYFKQASQAGGEIGKQSTQQLTALQLELQPQSFIGGSAGINSRGFVQVSLSNRSPVPMTQVQVRVDRMASAYQIQSSQTLLIPQTIAAGTSLQLELGSAAEDTQQSPRFRVVVLSAKAIK